MPLTVNGETIDDALLRNEEDLMRPRLREAMPEVEPEALETRLHEWARENCIERVLLRQAAMQEGGPVPAEVLADPALLQAEKELRVARLAERLTAKLVPPRSKEIGEYYRKHQEEFVAPEMVHAAHILKKVEDEAGADAALEQMRAIRAELEQGADFAQLADRHSDDAGSGGELGYFARGQMVEEFDAVAFALQPGQLSDVFRSQFGFHVVKVFDRRPAGTYSFADVKGNIEKLLFEQKKQRRIEQFADSLRAKADIQQ